MRQRYIQGLGYIADRSIFLYEASGTPENYFLYIGNQDSDDTEYAYDV